MELRPYQREAILSLVAGWGAGARRLAVVLPTGSGKTIVFSHLIQRMRTGAGIARTLVIAHREELLEQAADKIRAVAPHLKVGIIKGNRRELRHDTQVIVASVQTLGWRRPCRNKVKSQDGRKLKRCGTCTRCNTLPNCAPIHGVGMIVVDECHHAGAASYKRVLRHFRAFDEDSKVLTAGFTATLARQQGGLASVWQDVAYRRDISDMIADGYLVPPTGKQVVVPGMDLDQAKKSGGDFTGSSLAELMLHADAMSEIAQAYREYAPDRPGIVFSPNVEVAHEMTDAFNGIGIPAATVWGDMPAEERHSVLKDFKSGKVQVLSNVMVLTEGFDEPKASCLVVARPTMNPGLYCLDERTEILTDQGWRGADDTLSGTRLAAFNLADNSVHWSDVLGHVDRPLTSSETMYGITSPTASIRVSDKHRMVWKPRAADSEWRVSEARTLAERRSGYVFPIAGIQESPGVPLTDDELRFIGWFMSDGTINQKTNAITISQAEHQPWNSDIVAMLEGCGFKYRVYRTEQNTKFSRSSTGLHYTVSKGAPRGEDKHLRGWGGLEDYLSKNLAPALEDMTKRQLGVFLHALWLGDGRKSQGPDWTSQSYHISTGNKLMADRIQSLCVRRGFKCNVSEHSYNANPLYELHIKDTMLKSVGGAGQLDREHFKQVPHQAGERVWCVETDAGTIITRRDGKVAVVGNCQMAGRVLRPSPETGKTDALILDVTGVTSRHKLASIVDLGVQKDKPENKAQNGNKDGPEIEEEEVPDEPSGPALPPDKELLQIAGWRDVQIYHDPQKTYRAHWVRTPKGNWFVAAGDNSYFVVRGLVEGTWHKRGVFNGEPMAPPPANDLPMSMEQAVLELDRIGVAKAGNWDDPEAPWRKKAPSEKMLAAAFKMGIRVEAGMRAGEVSDLITSRLQGRKVDWVIAQHERMLKKKKQED